MVSVMPAPALQLEAVKAAGCEKVFVEKASAAQGDRLKLLGAEQAVVSPAAIWRQF